MEIDRTAPMRARGEIVIDAPIESVWALETDIDAWPQWQPGVTAAKLEGDLAVGSVFRWKGGGLNITSTLREVDPPRRIGWTGDAMGIKAVHVFSFEPYGTGTRVISEESWSGWFTRLLKLLDRRMLEKSIQSSLETLKSKAEQGNA